MTGGRHPVWAVLVVLVTTVAGAARAADVVCYGASARRADRARASTPVAVQDRFGVRSVLPRRPVALCRVAGDDADDLWVGRRAKVDGGRRARRIGERIEVATRFGVERVTVKTVSRVLLAGAPGDVVQPAGGRATCYAVKGSRRSRGVVVLSDPLGEHVLRVGAPRRLCVDDAGAERICHAAKPVRGAAVDGGGTTIVSTVLGAERLAVGRVAELCVDAGEVEPPPEKPDFFLRITPSAATLTAGEQGRLQARAFFDAGGSEDWSDRLTWTSSDETVAVVRASVGGALVDALGPGTATISATHPPTGASTTDAEGDATLTVIWTLEKLTMAPSAVRKPVGGTEDFTVTGHFASGVTLNVTQRVTYASSNPSVVRAPNAAGRRSHVEALAPGVARISATDPISGIRTTDAGNDATVRVAGGMPFLQIDPAREQRLVLDVGAVHQFTAVAVFPDGIGRNVTQECIWSSQDAGVIAPAPLPTQASRFMTVAPGTTFVECEDPASGAIGSIGLDVVTSELVGLVVRGADWPPIFEAHPRRATAIGTFAPFEPREFPFLGARNVTQDVLYVSRDPDVVIAPNEEGDRSRLEGLGAGTARVYAVDPASGTESPDHVVVSFGALVGVALKNRPYRDTVLKGSVFRYGLRGIFEGGSWDLDRFAQPVVVVFESDDPSVVAPTADGQSLVAVEAGTTTVRARLVDVDAVSDPVPVTVKGDVARLTVTPSMVRRAIGEVQRFTTRAFSPPDFDESFTQVVEYRSSDPSVAVALNTPGDRSTVRAVGAGTAVVSARLPGGDLSSDQTGTSATIEVLPGAIERITIAPVTRTIVAGDTTAFTATAHYPDGRTINATQTVFWAVADASVAQTIGRPRILGLAPGTTRVAALHPSGVGSTDSGDDATLTVETLSELILSPAVRSAAAGTAVRYTLVGRLADGSEINFTQQAGYAVDPAALALAANDDGDRSRIDLLAPGTVTVNAFVLNQRATATLTITP